MSSDVHRLTFTLPPALRLGVVFGRHQPCLHGCLLSVGTDYRVEIQGPFRERVFDQAKRFLRVHARGHGEQTIEAVLRSPAPSRGADTWWIIINAEISFSPTPIAPYLGDTILSAG